MYNILIVDDSEIIRAVIIKTIKVAKIDFKEIFQASNGQEALQILEDNWVDLVFADINMPVMNGLEMIKKMSESDLLKTIPVVVVSTEGSQTRMEKLFTEGIKAYLRKPFTPEQIKSTFDKIMGARNGSE